MVRYEHPRKAIFNVTTDEYGPDGWIEVEEEKTIIGEVDIGYIYGFITTGHGMWEGDDRYQVEYTSANWIHRSRFVRWVTTQTELFHS
jgi:hypothetical protein